uniref:NADH-ubiquinone oxidoreductase chain 3 n=1 Tax=Sophonia nigrilineata TaxID=3092776 RepID=A0AAF0Z410_9HEMI|nr:NADH dehydrogenase subunit 3 [Sophonia nigrilineata]WPC85227.1 NADH dehydrogenase subunit 3 [Sophonia nigrilineata]
MKLLLLNFLLISVILMTMFTLVLIVSKKSNIDLQKSSPFECGFNPISYKRMPFSIHFFLIAVIFLVFDIEVIIIIPSILTFKYSMLFYWLMTLILFLLILMLGLIHEWLNGMLNWTN